MVEVELKELIRSLLTTAYAFTRYGDGSCLEHTMRVAEALQKALEGEIERGEALGRISLYSLDDVAAKLGMMGKDRRGNAERRMRHGTKEDDYATTYPVIRSRDGELLYDPDQLPGCLPPRIQRRPAITVPMDDPREIEARKRQIDDDRKAAEPRRADTLD